MAITTTTTAMFSIGMQLHAAMQLRALATIFGDSCLHLLPIFLLPIRIPCFMVPTVMPDTSMLRPLENAR